LPQRRQQRRGVAPAPPILDWTQSRPSPVPNSVERYRRVPTERLFKLLGRPDPATMATVGVAARCVLGL
jgi:hypothetical protein